MSELTKTKILNIETGQATKNVDKLTSSFVPLKRQIRDLVNQLGALEQGTEEYSRTAKQLADLQQRQVEVMEAAKYSNKDFGQVMSNLTSVSMGLVGGINAVSASMALLGGDSEKMQKALVPIQMVMAAIQGFSALDDAIKSLEGLKLAFSDLGDVTDVAKIEAVKTEVESIPDVKTINIEVNSGTATAELAGVKAAAEGVAEAEGNIASKGKLVSATNTGIAKTGKGIKGILSGVAKGFKTAALAVRSFITANPILAALAALIAGVALGIAFLNKKLEENGRVAREEADIISKTNSAYKEQNVRLNVLLQTARNNNESLAERKKAVEELNKIIPDYNARLDETTGKYTANNEALETYLKNLKQKLQLEAYEGKIKEYLQKQLELEEEINDIRNTGWWRVKGRIRDRKKEIAEIDRDIQRIYNNISRLDLGAALNDNKVAQTAKNTNGVAKVLKSVAEALKESRKTANDFWDTFFNARKATREIRGLVSDFNNLNDDIKKISLKVPFDFEETFTEEFRDFLKGGKLSVYEAMFAETFTMKDVLKHPNVFDDLRAEALGYAKKVTQINEALKNNTGNLTAAQTRQYEEEKRLNEERLADINRRLQGYTDIVTVVNKYRESMMEAREAKVKEDIATVNYLKSLEIQKRYLREIKEGDYLADANRNISSLELEYETLQRTNNALKDRVQIYTGNADLRKVYKDRIKEWNREIEENERGLAEREIQIDAQKYDRRKKQAEEYYNGIDQLAKDNVNKAIVEDSGGGKNLLVERQKIELQAIRDKMDAVRQAYENGLMSEAEYNSKSLELQAEYVTKSKEFEQQHTQSILQTAQTYTQTVQMIGSSISGVLQEVMANYDENSEEYKKMAVANAVIQTISGQLGAFFSGVNSGVPAPWNFVLGGVLATAALTTGLIGISNIKSGKLGGISGNISSSASSLGTNRYETTAYAQQSELFGSVTDRKVYVLEHDISSAQNNVNVLENDNSF